MYYQYYCSRCYNKRSGLLEYENGSWNCPRCGGDGWRLEVPEDEVFMDEFMATWPNATEAIIEYEAKRKELGEKRRKLPKRDNIIPINFPIVLQHGFAIGNIEGIASLN